MLNITVGYGFAFMTAIAVLAGDYFIKVAADDTQTMISRPFLMGICLYAVSAALWFGSMRFVGLIQAAVAYSMLTLLAMCIMGVVVFGEILNPREYLGITFALLSMTLMVRFV